MTVLFFGPLPPPVHGFAAVNAAMLERLQAVTTVIVFDRSPGTLGRGLFRHARLLCRTLGHLFRFVWVIVTQRPSSLYVGFSGGAGQLLDLPFLCLANLLSLSIFVHHHSFAYMHRRQRRTALCLRAAPKASHIVLCGDMAERLEQHYGIRPTLTYRLSNAGFFKPGKTGPTVERTAAAPRVGFLSNITAEKGIFEFLEITGAASEIVPGLETLIAGPLDPAVEVRFNAALLSRFDIRYFGAVHGPERDAFYKSIDLLLLPTRYVNEAEPLTLLEALESGVEVIATSRGCIAGMIPIMCGAAPQPENFLGVALTAISTIATTSREERAERRKQVAASFALVRDRHAAALNALLETIAEPSRSSRNSARRHG